MSNEDIEEDRASLANIKRAVGLLGHIRRDHPNVWALLDTLIDSNAELLDVIERLRDTGRVALLESLLREKGIAVPHHERVGAGGEGA